MKIKENYILRQVAGSWVVLPVGEETLNFNGMLTLNNSGRLLWQALETGADRDALADVLTREYDVSRETALTDADEFVATLRKAGCLAD